MTPEQAIKNLDSAASTVQANREVHITIMESTQILQKIVSHCREQGLIELIFEKDNANGCS